MPRSVAKKVVQVPIETELLEQIDETAGTVAESRAAFIREACRLRLKSLRVKDLERQYVDGYQKIPEDSKWAATSARLLSQILPKEKW